MPIKNYTTKIDAYTSIGEIQGALARSGAKQIMVEYENERPMAISFTIQRGDRLCGFRLPAATEGTLRVFAKQKLNAKPEQAEMTAWRNVRDWVLAQLALIECCDVPVDQVFLPYLVDQSGRRTLYEAYSSGQLMLGNGDENG